jgi:hypothetical protein
MLTTQDLFDITQEGNAALLAERSSLVSARNNAPLPVEDALRLQAVTAELDSRVAEGRLA